MSCKGIKGSYLEVKAPLDIVRLINSSKSFSTCDISFNIFLLVLPTPVHIYLYFSEYVSRGFQLKILVLLEFSADILLLKIFHFPLLLNHEQTVQSSS